MPAPKTTSRCSRGQWLDFYWYGQEPSATAPIDAAAAEFAAFMRSGDLIWSAPAWAMVVAEFRSRLRLAKSGGLKPIDHVKQIGSAEPAEMLYEIRWDFAALAKVGETADGDPEVEERTVHVRLYHSEPPEEQLSFVGLHVHEKTIVPGDQQATKTLQDREIDVAVERFWKGAKQMWGIPQSGGASVYK